MYFLSPVCTFQFTIEMYGAPHEADDFGTGVPDSHGALSRHRFGAPHLYNTTAYG